jgi:metal-dependent HD superfamily phosphatase/phosphodiesterase
MSESIVTLADVRAHPATTAYLTRANEHLRLLGFTEHGIRHAENVSSAAARVLTQLGQPARDAELAAIAGLLHDIGNVINREYHGQIGALLAKDILRELAMPIDEVITVISAIGNHEEERGYPISNVAAAVILADKADVHRSRVHTIEFLDTDPHDRVNYAATAAQLQVDLERQTIQLELTIDPAIATVMDYFQIFLSRMVMCRKAAEFLSCRFQLQINGTLLG